MGGGGGLPHLQQGRCGWGGGGQSQPAAARRGGGWEGAPVPHTLLLPALEVLGRLQGGKRMEKILAAAQVTIPKCKD